MTPITDKIKQLPNGERIDPMKVFEQMPERQQNLVLAKAWIMQNDHFLFPLDGESEIDHHARILMVFAAQWRADLTAENARLVSDLEAKDEWRLALESFTPNGSEYVNDLSRCISFVREKFADRHEAKKEVVRLRRELETAKRALENCLLTANRVLARRNNPTNNRDEWGWVRNFCIEGGSSDSILRDDIAQAALKNE